VVSDVCFFVVCVILMCLFVCVFLACLLLFVCVCSLCLFVVVYVFDYWFRLLFFVVCVILMCVFLACLFVHLWWPKYTACVLVCVCAKQTHTNGHSNVWM